ncbi:Holliday junction resolvase RuvX [Aquipuribacter nitratireducens]|uniref:Putative pre-16S rRNA nuclease n=1 Tax=Aquipuribacter nitratireducens TaxID=650104 RepID=A0ABW0GQ75_9MICO
MAACLAVDPGSVRIGVAVSDPRRTIALPLGTVQRAKDGSDLRAIAALVAEREAADVVVGLPVGLSGREGPAAEQARAFARRLADALAPVPVRLVDERFTTTSAHRALHEAGRKGRTHRTVVDRTAAAILLQHVLDAEAAAGDPPAADRRAEPDPLTDGPVDRSER